MVSPQIQQPQMHKTAQARLWLIAAGLGEKNKQQTIFAT
jgi:hypothetical protein